MPDTASRVDTGNGKRNLAGEPIGTLALARALQLASAASPVGSYAYSEGMEHAVLSGDVRDEATARDWVEGLLLHGVCALDMPLLIKMYAAWADGRPHEALRLSAWLLACRECAELRRADRQQGRALLRVLFELGVGTAARLWADHRVGYACAFALAGRNFGLSGEATSVAYAYAWLENVTLAAVKLIPLGQRAGQRMIHDLASVLPERCEAARTTGLADIAAGAPGQAMASALHETQTTRLYRS